MIGNTFTSEDLAQLMQLAGSVAEARQCRTSEAVGLIRQTVEQASRAGTPRRRPAEFADRVRRLRVQRADRLNLDVFGEPAWDMMLDMLVARDQDRRVSITDLCLGSGVPATTALRHVDALVRKGVAERLPDARDGRRWFIRMKEGCATPLTEMVCALQECA